MLLTSLFAASALAWQTSAFLIPLKGSPEAQIPPKGEELRHRIVNLDCPNCPFAGPDANGSIWTVDDKPISVVSSLNILLSTTLTSCSISSSTLPTTTAISP